MSWPRRRLKYSCSVNPPSPRLASDALVSFVPMEAISENGGLDSSAHRQAGSVSSGYTGFSEGDVLVAKITPCFENGKGTIATGLLGGVGFGTTELHVLRPDRCDGRWLFYLTQSAEFMGQGEGSMYGAGGQKRVPPEFVKGYRAPTPPLATQRAIADFLDRKTAAIDALIEKKERLLTLLAEKRAAVIHQAVTKGLDPNVPMKDSGIPWIGDIPAHWEVRPLGYRSRMQGGSTPSKANPSFWGGDTPWVSPKDMKSFYIVGAQDGITDLALRETALRLIPPGATLVVVRGMILARTLPVGFNTVTVALNQDMKALQPDPCLDPEFLAWQLRARRLEAMPLIEEAGHGTKVFRTDLFAKLKVLIPPVLEQQAIISETRITTKRTDAVIQKHAAAVSLLREYRQALITAAVTGQLDIEEAA